MQRRWACSATAAALYLPFTWVLWIDYPWTDYRWLWVKMLPVLPGLLPSRLIVGHAAPEWVLFTLAGVLSGAALASAGWLAGRSRAWLVGVTIAGLAYSIPCAYGAYNAFRA
ncbi:MAG: hypothetical protein FJ255_01580 [Phycisphaerae bacterium]|nr:hypothetical protein [Phycisphaerae bacterium]